MWQRTWRTCNCVACPCSTETSVWLASCRWDTLPALDLNPPLRRFCAEWHRLIINRAAKRSSGLKLAWIWHARLAWNAVRNPVSGSGESLCTHPPQPSRRDNLPTPGASFAGAHAYCATHQFGSTSRSLSSAPSAGSWSSNLSVSRFFFSRARVRSVS